MKALFVTHDVSNYGASRSLQLLLQNYREATIDLLVPRPVRGRYEQSEVRKRFGPNVSQIFDAHLPFDACYQYANRDLLSRAILRGSNLLWRANAKRLAQIFERGRYDFIHLNSLVLHPLIDGRHPFVIHMRDVYDGSSPRALENVGKAAGVIFIDEATRTPFASARIRNSVTLNNPIDMRRVAEFASYRPEGKDLDPARHTIYSVIGLISESKGVGFIVRTFLAHEDDNARLLVVGGREPEVIEQYRRLARHDPRIIFWGEESDIAKVYAITDYVIRGEAFPCIGRTIYEGLYAGCRVIVPGDREHPPPMFEAERYRDAMMFYHPRNEADLLRVLAQSVGRKVSQREYRSNIDEYVESFHAFVTGIVQGHLPSGAA